MRCMDDTSSIRPTLILLWPCNALVGGWILIAVYGLLPRTVLLISGFVTVVIGLLMGILHFVLWRIGDLERPRLFYRGAAMPSVQTHRG